MQAVMERRLDLFVLMRNASRIAADDAYSFASMQLQLMLGRPEASFQASLGRAQSWTVPCSEVHQQGRDTSCAQSPERALW